MDANAAFALPTVPGPPTQGGDWIQAADWAEFERETARALPEGVRLQDYEIAGPIGEGGFGIVYLAWDPVQERHVAIKEYLPAVLASRDQASTGVVVRSPRHDDSFRIGLRSFLNEARILARFDHPALVRVLHYWEGNGTAYMAMPYYQGPTLARALAELGRPPEEAELRGWLRPLLDALGTLHAVHCLHRDIAPDNILLTEDGPVLLDFGAARRVIDGAGQSPTVVFKPGFTPLEQYGELASMRQGPWTDLYALAAVVYTAIAGQPPVSSVERMPDDPLRPLSVLARGRYSEAFLAGIDAALAVHPKDRPQSAAEFWERLGGADEAEGKGEATPDAAEATPPAVAIRPAEASVAVQPQPQAAGRGFVSSPPAPVTPRAEFLAALAQRPQPAPSGAGRLGLWGLCGAVVLAALGTAGYYRIGDPVLTQPPLAVQAGLPTPVPVPVPAVKAVPTAPAPVAKAVPVTPVPSVTVEPTMPVPLARTEPVSPPPIYRAEPVTPAPLPRVAPPVTKPMVVSAPVAKAEPARLARREPRAAAVEVAPPEPRRLQAEAAPASAPSRCSELLQRASLGSLAPGEVALLRKGCE
ncbi:serine/threonine protein kinase [Variovorax sp. JS1663]|uniref:serine/threonine protein kinase n=1 Tax=Variovorax sp. JS1663 TaxID=1851577 RepID=UPI000B69498E|nr:serine/threonine-protein kinase [Variovorax sp. JS1663]OUM02551.1 hypothetical protein A8M77_09760 [Variovorax sp. JS1663]